MSITRLGGQKYRRGFRLSDQYGPRVTLRIGPVEARMLQGIFGAEREATPSWVVTVGIAALRSGSKIPKYRHVQFARRDATTLPQTVYLRLTAHRHNELLDICNEAYLVELQKVHNATAQTLALRLAIWACWISLGCPLR